jgi:hypothetical protein
VSKRYQNLLNATGIAKAPQKNKQTITMKESGNIYYGTAANLSNCRSIITSMANVRVENEHEQKHDLQKHSNHHHLHNDNTYSEYLQLLTAAIRQPIHMIESSQSHRQEDQIEDGNGNVSDEEYILWGPALVEVDFHDDDDENHRNLPMGQLVITSQQLIFWMNAVNADITPVSTTNTADSTSESSSFLYEYDLRVDATCIDLHALTSHHIDHHRSNDNDDDDDNGCHNLNIDVIEDYSHDINNDKFEDADGDDHDDVDFNTRICDDEEGDAGGVYVQLSNGDNNYVVDDDDGHDHFQELTFRILRPSGSEPPSPPRKRHTSQTLFAAISQLIALHPINPHDDHTNPNDVYNFPTMKSTTDNIPNMWFGVGPVMTADGTIQLPDDETDENVMGVVHHYEDDDNDDDDDADELIIAPPRQQYNVATDENDFDNEQQQQQERMAMLERLDQLLIVPPEYEKDSDENDDNHNENGNDCHQFDDADSDNDLL